MRTKCNTYNKSAQHKLIKANLTNMQASKLSIRCEYPLKSLGHQKRKMHLITLL